MLAHPEGASLCSEFKLRCYWRSHCVFDLIKYAKPSSAALQMDPAGFEPAASRLQSERSTELIYRPAILIFLRLPFKAFSDPKMKVRENYNIKEVIHPQVPLRIPCVDLARLAELEFEHFNNVLIPTQLGWLDGQ